MATRRSVTSIIHECTEVSYACKIVKQSGVVHHTDGAEIRVFFIGIKRPKVFRRPFESLEKSIQGLTPSYEDNNAAIQKIKSDKLTPRIKHLDIMMIWLHQDHDYGIYKAIYVPTDRNKADMNTKAHGGQILQDKHLCLVGYRLYPKKGTKHYELLGLGKYHIGSHIEDIFYLIHPKKYTKGKVINKQICNIEVSKIHKCYK